MPVYVVYSPDSQKIGSWHFFFPNYLNDQFTVHKLGTLVDTVLFSKPIWSHLWVYARGMLVTVVSSLMTCVFQAFFCKVLDGILWVTVNVSQKKPQFTTSCLSLELSLLSEISGFFKKIIHFMELKKVEKSWSWLLYHFIKWIIYDMLCWMLCCSQGTLCP